MTVQKKIVNICLYIYIVIVSGSTATNNHFDSMFCNDHCDNVKWKEHVDNRPR